MESLLFKMAKGVEVKIHCETCQTIYYIGNIDPFLDKRLFDFKAVAFKHAWDNPEHSVLGGATVMPIDISTLIARQREDLRLRGDPKAQRKYDDNWNPKVDRCFCLICKAPYDNVKDACECHIEGKIVRYEE